MDARELFRAGMLDEAVAALGVEVRDDPLDIRRRTFLFELLCFAGSYERAEKQLDVLAQVSAQAALGTLLYRSALHAERTRQEMFSGGILPPPPVAYGQSVRGSINGVEFESITDADTRIGARFELFAAGQYTLIPFDQLASVSIPPPTQLRDLLWSPAMVRTGARFQGMELGEVLIPVLAPLSAAAPDDDVRLGRVTQWIEEGGVELPLGQRLLMVDGVEIPILEVRELRIEPIQSNDS